VARNDEITALKKQVAALTAEVAELKALQPPPEKPLLMSDLKVVGYQRPTLSLPEADWMPSRNELKDLGRIVHAKYPYLIEWTSAWLDQFHVCLLAVNHLGRTPKPQRDYGVAIGDWLTAHRYFGEVDRGPLMSAVAVAGDVQFFGFDERAMLSGTFPMAGIATRDRGSPPDRSAWKKVLSEKRLTGESAAAQAVNRYPGRLDNPRSHVELLPQYDRR